MKPKELKQVIESNSKYKSKGYILVYCPEHPNANSGGYVQEHRLIMENHIDAFLRKDLFVHHINKIKNDNRIENLLIVNSTQHSNLHKEDRVESMKKAVKVSAELRRRKLIDDSFYCNKCKSLKPKELFVVRNSRPNAVAYNCKECHNIHYKGGVKQYAN